MSYSYYLIHGLTLKASFLVLSATYPATHQGTAFFASLMVVMFAISLLPAAVLFLTIERPFSLEVHRARSAASPLVPKRPGT